MDITPVIAETKQLIQGYGNGGFRITETEWSGSVLVLPGQTEAWGARDFSHVSLESLQIAIAYASEIELLLIGCGPAQGFLPPKLRDELRRHGMAVDAMDTGAACRTFNVLMAEERRVAAALIAI